MDLDTKRMTVQTPAFVIFGKIRQPMRRLDGELLENFHNLLRGNLALLDTVAAG